MAFHQAQRAAFEPADEIGERVRRLYRVEADVMESWRKADHAVREDVDIGAAFFGACHQGRGARDDAGQEAERVSRTWPPLARSVWRFIMPDGRGVRMSADANPDNRWEPLHDAHAIEQTAFFYQFSSPLDDDQIQAISSLSSEKFKDEFPKQLPILVAGVAISFGGAAPMSAPAAPPQTGLLLQKVQANGTIEVDIRVDRTSLSFRTTAYTRWADVWTLARRYFHELLPFYTSKGQLTSVGLNYVDKFVWKGLTANCDVRGLLKPASLYLAPHIYQAPDLWHTHSGAFVRPDASTKRLINVNVDYLDETIAIGTTRRIVAITTMLTDTFNQPGYKQIDLSGPNLAEICNTHMEELHLCAKRIVEETVSESLVKRIALWAP